MKMKKIYNKSILFAVFLLMLFVTMARVNALDINIPKPLIFAQYSNITSKNIQVFNADGNIYDPNDLNCSINIYDSLNINILEQNLTANLNGVDLKVTLDPTMFEKIGEYGFIIWCKSATEDGFISSSFKVTRSGSEFTDQSGLIAGSVFIIGLVGLLFLFGSLVSVNEDWLQAIKLLVNIIGLFMLQVGAGFIYRSLYMLDYPASVVNIAGIIYFALLFVILPLLLIFVIMFIKQLLELWESIRKGDKFN